MGECAALKGIRGAGSNPRTVTNHQPGSGRLNGRCPWPFPCRAFMNAHAGFKPQVKTEIGRSIIRRSVRTHEGEISDVPGDSHPRVTRSRESSFHLVSFSGFAEACPALIAGLCMRSCRILPSADNGRINNTG